MKNTFRNTALSLVAMFTLLACSDKADSEISTISSSYGELGTVEFPVSCNDSAQGHMTRGLALLHHMTYEDAHQAFVEASEEDPECAMSYWGQAMTFIHPLWPDQPDEISLKNGWALVNEARGIAQKTERESAYIEALAGYYNEGWARSEQDRLKDFEKGWAAVYERFPDDMEGVSFYALAYMATASPEDKTYEKQRRAGELVARVLERIPDHPGAHHYTIHAYDLPDLADRALNVARNYGKIAPEVPHALHMPTHIFTRLGYWNESIDWNKRSADAAINHPVNGKLSMHYMHALDYLAYAYLQQGQVEKADEVQSTMYAIDGSIQSHAGTAYTLSAVPARLTLERQQWTEAAGIELWAPEDFSWENFAPFEAITFFAKALGAARAGDIEAAQSNLQHLDVLRQKTPNAYWKKQVEIQYLAAQAWINYAQGNREKALELMVQSADLETSTEKHPITPGEVLPSTELLGDMLLVLDRPGEAIDAYEAALARSPNRYNSLYGAGLAAERTGDEEKAKAFYEKLLEVVSNEASDDDRLTHAKAFLQKSAASD